MSLFGRRWKVTVDGLDVTPLHLEFRVLRTIKSEPNKASLTLYNLSADHRGQLLKRNAPADGSKKLTGIPVQIEAGYGDNIAVLFSGDLSTLGNKLDDKSWKTTLSGSDGGRAWREGRINTQFTEGTPFATVFKRCCDAMSVGLGNASNFQAQAQLAGAGTTVTRSFTASGSAADILKRVVASMQVPDPANPGSLTGVTWSIQNGALQLQVKGKPLNLAALRITPQSGLIGSPESSVDSTVSLGNPQQFAPGAKAKKAKAPKPKDPGIIKFKTLLIGGVDPGRKLSLGSREYDGEYGLSEVLSVGSSFAQDWYHECVGRLAS